MSRYPNSAVFPNSFSKSVPASSAQDSALFPDLESWRDVTKERMPLWERRLTEEDFARAERLGMEKRPFQILSFVCRPTLTNGKSITAVNDLTKDRLDESVLLPVKWSPKVSSIKNLQVDHEPPTGRLLLTKYEDKPLSYSCDIVSAAP
jgi:hypothetical protein